MIFVGDYFALGIIAILSTAHFTSKHFLTKSSRIYTRCLIFSACTATFDLISGCLLWLGNVPYWIHMAVNTLYFLFNIIFTSQLSMFMLYKIYQHIDDDGVKIRNSRIGICCIFSIYFIIVIANIFNGWLFYIDENGIYHRGVFNFCGHLTAIIQMFYVIFCYLKNIKQSEKVIGQTLVYICSVIVFWTIVQMFVRNIILNGFIMSMLCLILYLKFQGQRRGLHALTNLNDRPRFFQEIEYRLENAQKFQIFTIHLKKFGEINQKYSYKKGDEVLYQFAFNLDKLFHKGVAFHLGSVWFALIIPYTNDELADENYHKLKSFIDKGVVCMGTPISGEAMVLEYIVKSNDITANEIQNRLEYMEIVSKIKKTFHMKFDDFVALDMAKKLFIYKRLQNINEYSGFQVWLQPLFNVQRNGFFNAEALIRLTDANGTFISPAEFITLAEVSGLIDNITWFVLDRVCKSLHDEPTFSNLRVSVNVPMTQLLDDAFFDKLNKVVDSYNLEHNRICIEFTERTILENFQLVQDKMLQMSKSGYDFYLDDFGTGYSNFNCLLQLPFACIKLDRSLILEMNNNNIVPTLIKIFHSLKLDVIAEGAEEEQQINYLKQHGIDGIQGFYYAKPMPIGECINFINKNK